MKFNSLILRSTTVQLSGYKISWRVLLVKPLANMKGDKYNLRVQLF